MGVVVALYSKTDAMVKPWVEAGYRAVLVDLQHPEGEHTSGRITRIGADMLTWYPPKWLAKADVAFVAAFPPCDHLAVSGARWFAGKGLGKLAHSVQLFERAAYWCEWFEAPYLIENPVSTISSYWRKPDHTFHPFQFTRLEPSDNYTKKTCLWIGRGFVMPHIQQADLGSPDDRIHKAPPHEGRADFRSATPLGFARAVFAANSQIAEAV
jgi:hypothetical protein